MASPWGSVFFLLPRSWPGQYCRFILGDAKRRWVTEQFSSRLGEYCRWMCDVDWFGTFGISLPAMNYTNYIYNVYIVLYSVHYHVWFDVLVLTFMLPTYAMWVLNDSECAYAMYAQCVLRIRFQMMLFGAVCSTVLSSGFQAADIFHGLNWPHLWREDFIAAICCNDGPLPLASTYVDGCWWHFNLNSVRCSNYNHVTN